MELLRITAEQLFSKLCKPAAVWKPRLLGATRFEKSVDRAVQEGYACRTDAASIEIHYAFIILTRHGGKAGLNCEMPS